MSDEYRPDDEPGRKATEDEVEAHGPVGLGPTGMGPTGMGPTAGATDDATDEEPEVEAHGPVGLGPTGMGPTGMGPTQEGPTAG